MKVAFHELGSIEDQRLDFAVIGARVEEQWLFVKHRDRQTWEIPGGHREMGEAIEQTAARELTEETGATDFALKPLCEYSVERDGQLSYGRLFFAKILRLGPLPDSEIARVEMFQKMPDPLTYPLIQPLLHAQLESESQLVLR